MKLKPSKVALLLAFSIAYAIANEEKTNTPVPSPDQIKAEATEAWYQIDDHLSAQALTDFLAKYPASEQASKAKLYLGLVQKMEEFRTGKSKSALVIPFESLSDCWGLWRAGQYCYKSAVIIAQKVDGDGLGMPDGFGARFDGDGKPVLPSKDGSLVILKSTVSEPVWKDSADSLLGGAVISAKGQEPIYFAIIDKLGLVHLQGACTVAMKNSLAPITIK